MNGPKLFQPARGFSFTISGVIPPCDLTDDQIKLTLATLKATCQGMVAAGLTQPIDPTSIAVTPLPNFNPADFGMAGSPPPGSFGPRKV